EDVREGQRVALSVPLDADPHGDGGAVDDPAAGNAEAGAMDGDEVDGLDRRRPRSRGLALDVGRAPREYLVRGVEGQPGVDSLSVHLHVDVLEHEGAGAPE